MLIRITLAAAVVTALAAAPAHAASLTVGQGLGQCPHAQFASIQAAVDNARPGDTVKVCAGTYAEQVTVSMPLVLKGEAAVVDPPDGKFTVAFRLAADDVELRGFTIQGASVGVDTSDRFSGYRVDHNAIRDNSLFAIDAGSAGARPSRFDHNSISGNPFGLVSELTDDSLWPQPPDGGDRGAHARNLRNARVDHNDTTLNGSGVEAAGPGQPVDVSFDHNQSRGDGFGIAIQNSIASRIADNEIVEANAPIYVGGANTDLHVTDNLARGINYSAITFTHVGFLDAFPAPSRFAVIRDNDARSSNASGISFNPNSLQDSLVRANTADANGFSGLTLGSGNSGNVIRDNQIDENPRSGLIVRAGATGNTLVGNSMHNNGAFDPLSFFDARDDNTPLNRWEHNDCGTDFPAGSLCGGE